MTPADLIAFEESIADAFNRGEIRSPVHLSSGNEANLIDIFKDVKPEDYVCCSWRSHLHCLLKGVPPDELRAAIFAGKSIALCFPEYLVISSAIAGGIIPIATGIAMWAKRTRSSARVWLFLGDMTAEMGIAWECFKYASAYDLPIMFVIEDNNKSVCTDTRATWNTPELLPQMFMHPKKLYYKYESKWPHAGAGRRISF